MHNRPKIGLIGLVDIFKSIPKSIGFVLFSRREASNSFGNGR